MLAPSALYMNRRTVLCGAIAVGSSLGLAGCLDDGGADDGSTTLTEESVETIASDCGGEDDDDATVRFESGALSIEGTITAPTPCYEATLETTLEDGALSVRIDTQEEESEELCVTCIGSIEYEAFISFDGDPPSQVTVTHAGVEETSEVATASP